MSLTKLLISGALAFATTYAVLFVMYRMPGDGGWLPRAARAVATRGRSVIDLLARPFAKRPPREIS